MIRRAFIALLFAASPLLAETPTQRIGQPLEIREIYIPGGEVKPLSCVHLTIPCQVEDITYIRAVAARYGVGSDPRVPAPLPNGAIFRFAIREIYPWDNPQILAPLEYLSIPSHFHVMYDSRFDDLDAIYNQVRRLCFKQVAPASVMTCGIDCRP